MCRWFRLYSARPLLSESFTLVDDPVNQSRPAREGLFAQLLTRHRSQIFRLVFCMVHTQQDAEDVFQQAALTMWDNFEKFDPNTDFVAWASQIARHKALNFLTSRGRRRICFSPELIGEMAQIREPNNDFHEARLRALASCRGKLSEPDQQLLALCYAGNETIRDAAKHIGRPAGSVYDSLMRIRRALFDCIQRTLSKEGWA
jgi:RNA polymerase sigma-70 factor (ECF subfamily)